MKQKQVKLLLNIDLLLDLYRLQTFFVYEENVYL